MPARYRVRLHGKTLAVWDIDPSHAGQTAQEWLDDSDKAGIDPLAAIRLDRITGDTPNGSRTCLDCRPNEDMTAKSTVVHN